MAVRKANPGRTATPLPSFASLAHGMTNAHEGSAAVRMSAEEVAAREAAREGALWATLELWDFERRITKLYRADYACLGLCARGASSPSSLATNRRLSPWG